MGASFRNTGELLALAGCDRLTIAPALLSKLEASTDHVARHLHPDHAKAAKAYSGERLDTSEKAFRYQLNGDAM